eukprot:CAMPEP_0178400764 /NCGR_PEP_ID=MMETSP0689_2-20121128/15956_1 /TAXON_ID=160604 /ORGANISM="Amphidinium massartii, Strain CS-259" /LENGTH=739 /DNA_ID=CAMNT_0020021567 /DNA_START=52 /DNA_END=2268 /DNA_ORIENTATION=+
MASVLKQGNLTVERVRHIRKRKLPTWCVLVSEGRGLLHLRLYDDEHEIRTGIRPLQELEVRADLVQRTGPEIIPPGFTILTKRPFQEKITIFEASTVQECDAWVAALTAGGKRDSHGNRTTPLLEVPKPPTAGESIPSPPSSSSTSTTKPSISPQGADTKASKAMVAPLGSVAPGLRDVINEMPQLPVVDRPMRHFFHIMHDFVRADDAPDFLPPKSVAANHKVFMELFSRFDRLGLEAMIHPEATALNFITDVNVSGRADIVDMLYQAARMWTLVDMSQVEVLPSGDDAEYTKCTLTLEHQVFHVELTAEQNLEWIHGMVRFMSVEVKKGTDFADKIKRFMELRNNFQSQVEELVKGPLPFDVIHDENQEAKMLSKFEMTKLLGAGSFGTVKLAVNKEDGTLRAIKEISKQLAWKEDVEREIHLMRAAQAAMDGEPYIVQLFETYEGEEAFFLVMEVVTGGELFDRIKKAGHFSEDMAKTTMRQLMRGMSRLHEAGVMHRDLKPENLLYADKEYSLLKIADFGLSGFFKDPFTLQDCCGTPSYMAPELILSGESCIHDDFGMPMRVIRTYGPAVDLWSCAVILYQLLSGKLPFPCEWKELPADDPSGEAGYWDVDALYESILKVDYNFPQREWSAVSDQAVDFICRILLLNPSKRLTAATTFDHPWMSAPIDEAPDSPTTRPLHAAVAGISRYQASLKSGRMPDGKSSVAAKQRVKDRVSTMGWDRFQSSGQKQSLQK